MAAGLEQQNTVSVAQGAIALVGNPNTGKTTLFNALTGMSQRVGNFPGVTVERKSGRMQVGDGTSLEVIDLPGAYSLSAQSPDEMIAVDVLLGLLSDETPIQGVIAVLDASNLKRNLYLVSQMLELNLPVVVALNMSDVARTRGIHIDTSALGHRLGVPVVSIQANRRVGLDDLKASVREVLSNGRSEANLSLLPEVWRNHVRTAAENLDGVSPGMLVRALADTEGQLTEKLAARFGSGFGRAVKQLEIDLGVGGAFGDQEVELRYAWVDRVLDGTLSDPEPMRITQSDKIDRVVTHRFWGTLIFAGIMGIVFQSIFSWAAPFMDWIDGSFGQLGAWVVGQMPEGALQSLVVDGVIAGVGGVVIFLPQICILFLFISLLEDCGYMARAAFLMDRLLTRCGLSGKSFIPMLSSFACAVPGVMATRTIEDRKDRIATMLVAPLMSCSARLPVYTIFIAAFIPDKTWAGFGLQGLTLFAMYGLGIVVAVPIAWTVKKTLLKGETTPFILELPSYKIPDARTVVMRVYQSAGDFLQRAGSLILAATIVMWALAYFPRPEALLIQQEQQRMVLQAQGASEEALSVLDGQLAGELISQSYLGTMGKAIEPVVRPLGWDWRIGMATIASFPAREVIVAVLGTIYSLGEVDEGSVSLREALQNAIWEDGNRVFNIPVALSVMVFFALCAQCVSTLAVIGRETQSWRWPLITFFYMTGLAYIGALITYQLGMFLGWG
ncbi:MAG: ferrous iron transport protein B [Candidatus Latescibacterota bacterium]|jgi:ferrous iron transport protein B